MINLPMIVAISWPDIGTVAVVLAIIVSILGAVTSFLSEVGRSRER
jgi:hypothetical protein